MNGRIRRILGAAGLAAAAVLLPACIEADMQTELREDGSGTLGTSIKFTEKFVEIANRMKKLDSKGQDIAAAMNDFPRMPNEALAAELEKGGLKVVECAAVSSEKEISARMKVEFRDMAALALMGKLEAAKAGEKASNPGDGIAVTRDANGVYTLSFGMDQNAMGGGGDADGEGPTAAPEAKEEEEEEADPEAQAEKMQEAMALMGELMGEASKLKIVVGIKVPGEIVDHAPKAGAKVEGGKVTWTMDFGTMMQMGMQGMGDEDAHKMKVSFKMPEGKSLPDSVLTPVKKEEPKPAAPAPAAPEGPVPPPPPAGGGD